MAPFPWKSYAVRHNRTPLPAYQAHATATKLYLEPNVGLSPGDANNLSYWTPAIPIAGEPLDVPTGGSIIEPGVTLSVDTTLGWDTWDAFCDACGR